jgi:SAM-dependent methyltransferase
MKDRVGKMLMARRIEAVLPHVSGELLDIGCGTNQLRQAYGSGVGVDVYPWENVDLVVNDTSKLPFPACRFDTVSMVACLNHIPNRDAVLDEAYRVLRPGGRIVLTMIPPAISGVWHRIRKPWDGDQTERGMRDGEVYGINRARMQKLLTRAGFRVVHESPFMLGINRVTVGQKSTLRRAAA